MKRRAKGVVPLEALEPLQSGVVDEDRSGESANGDSETKVAKPHDGKVALLFELAKLLLLVVIAISLTVIAITQRRQLVLRERQDCRERANVFRDDTGLFSAEYFRTVEAACGSAVPRGH